MLERESLRPEYSEMHGYLYELATPVIEGNLDGIIARRILPHMHKLGKIPHLKIPRNEYVKATNHVIV